MDINNQDNFSQLINLSLLTTFYTQLKNQFVLIDNYNDFYNSVNQKIQENTKNIDDIKINLNNNYYTKDDIDSEFDLLNQGIMTNYYSKTDIDSKIIVINNNINNLSQNLNNNYYNKTYIDNNFLSLNGGTLQGNLTAPTFIGNLNGNATSSTTATKVSNKLIFTGAINSTYDGSKEITVNIPTQLEGDYLPLSGGTLTGNLNSRSIIPTSNSTYNLGSSTYKYNIVYANTFNGNATSSSTASKVANKLTFTGASTGTYDGSSAITINIPEFQQTNGILTIQLNGGNVEGSNKFTFNGSVNKTINITPSSIGAVTSSELNNYLSLLGGTINGNLYVNGTITANNLNGELNGNATSANKVNNQLSFIGYQTKSYDGSQAVEIEIPDKTSQLTNDSNFATTDYVDNKEFVGLNKDSIIRYPKDLPIPDGYELVEEQFSALTDANNELILQAPLTAPQNLLINGDFKINQRGQTTYTGSSYSLDMWLLTNGQLTKNEIGITLNANDSQYNLILYQFIESDVFKKNKGVVVAKIDGILHVYEINSGKESQNEPYLFYDEDDINVGSLYFYWNNSRNKYDFYISVNRTRSVQVEYIDLFEGSIAYPHIAEDDAIALMRCQQYLRTGYYMAHCIFSYGNGTRLLRMAFEKMYDIPSIKLTISYLDSQGITHNTTNYSVRSALNGVVTFLLNDTTTNAVNNGAVMVYAEITCEPL